MDRIVRPSEVALYSDGGNELEKEEAAMLITNGAVNGPYFENYERYWNRLPHKRHGDKGGLSVAVADGSAVFMKAVDWTTIDGRRYVKRYAPRIRISPYNVGPLPETQP